MDDLDRKIFDHVGIPTPEEETPQHQVETEHQQESAIEPTGEEPKSVAEQFGPTPDQQDQVAEEPPVEEPAQEAEGIDTNNSVFYNEPGHLLDRMTADAFNALGNRDGAPYQALKEGIGNAIDSLKSSEEPSKVDQMIQESVAQSPGKDKDQSKGMER